MEPLDGAQVVLEIPNQYFSILASTRKDGFGGAPGQRIGWFGLMPLKNDVGSTGLLGVLGLHALLLVVVPDEHVQLIGVRGHDLSVLEPRLEAVDFSRVGQQLFDLKLAGQALELLGGSPDVLVVRLIFVIVLFDLRFFELVTLAGQVDLSDSKDRCSSSDPFLVVVFIVDSCLICASPKVNLLSNVAVVGGNNRPPATA